MELPPLDFETSAYTNSTTPANNLKTGLFFVAQTRRSEATKFLSEVEWS